MKKKKNLLEDSKGKIFSDINCTNVFLGQSPKATEIKISKWDRIPGLTNFAQQRKHKKKKHKPTEWKKIFANDVTDKGLISKMYKQLIQFNSQKNKQPNRKIGRTLRT